MSAEVIKQGKERPLGILGRKVGMTTVYDETQQAVGVTVLEVGPCVVLGKRLPEKDGYSAIQLGFGQKPERKVSKPEAGHLKAAGGVEKARRFVREIRIPASVAESIEVGQELSLSDLNWALGSKIDVTGKSIGKGFQGVFRRYNFRGFHETHDHEFRRHGGSIGCRKWPGRVFKGRKMPGRMGGKKVTTQNLKIVQIIAEDNLILVKGAVPGAKNGYVTLRPAIKNVGNPRAS